MGQRTGLKGGKASKSGYTYVVRLGVAVLPAHIGVVGVCCAVAVLNPGES